MNISDQLRVRLEIEQLLVEYWHDVDHHWGRNAHEYFLEDGIFMNSAARGRQGREAIKDFYSGRQDRGPRIARHVFSNLRVIMNDATHVTSEWILQIFAADGEPMLPSEPAILVADVTDLVELCPDGRWRYRSRTIKGLFKGSTPTTT